MATTKKYNNKNADANYQAYLQSIKDNRTAQGLDNTYLEKGNNSYNGYNYSGLSQQLEQNNNLALSVATNIAKKKGTTNKTSYVMPKTPSGNTFSFDKTTADKAASATVKQSASFKDRYNRGYDYTQSPAMNLANTTSAQAKITNMLTPKETEKTTARKTAHSTIDKISDDVKSQIEEAIKKNNGKTTMSTSQDIAYQSGDNEGTTQTFNVVTDVLKKNGYSDADAQYIGDNWDTLNGIIDAEKYEKKSSSALSAQSDKAYDLAKQLISVDSASNQPSDLDYQTIGKVPEDTTISNESKKMSLLEQLMAETGLSLADTRKYIEYVQEREDLLNTQAMEQNIQNDINEHPVLNSIKWTAADIAASPVSGLMAASQALVRNADSEAPVNTNSSAYLLQNMGDTTEEAVSNKINNPVGQFAYGTAVSIGKSALSMATGAGVAKALGLAGESAKVVAEAVTLPEFGGSAFSNTLKTAQDSGMSTDNAVKYALASGAAEMIFEKIGMDSIVEAYAERTAGKTALKDVMYRLLLTSVSEGSEEVMTDIANAISDDAINGAFSEAAKNLTKYKEYFLGKGYSDADAEEMAKKQANTDFRNQLIESFGGGFIAGFVQGGGASLRGRHVYNQMASTISENKDDPNISGALKRVYDTAKAAKEGTTARKIADSVESEDELSSSQIAQILESEASISESQELSTEEYVKKGVEALGYTGKEARNISKQIMKGLSTDSEDVTEEDSNKLEELTASDEGIADLYVGALNSENATVGAAVNEAAQAASEVKAKNNAEKTANKTNQKLVEATAKGKKTGIVPVTVGDEDTNLIGIKNNKELTVYDSVNGTRTVDISDVKFSQDNINEQQIWQTLTQTKKIGNKSDATRMARLLSTIDAPASVSTKGAIATYNAAMIGESFEDILNNGKNTWVAQIPEATLKEIYYLGQNEKNAVNEALPVKQHIVSARKANPTVTVDEDVKAYIPEGATNLAKVVADIVGSDINFTMYNEHDSEGYFDRADRVINVAYGYFAGGIEHATNIKRTLGHEAIGEYIENLNPEGKKLLNAAVREILMKNYGAKATTDTIKKRQLQYQNKLKAGETAEQALGEVTNDVIGEAIFTEEGMKDIIEYGNKLKPSERRTLFQTVIDFLQSVIDSIKSFINNSTENQIIRDTSIEDLEKLRKMIMEQLDVAVQNDMEGKYTQAKIDKMTPEQVIDAAEDIPGTETKSFKLGSEVEITDKLIAVHNLTEDQLYEDLLLGGFPSPSVAIVKMLQGHIKYGEISAVFDKSTIDPKNPLNFVYGADAYTPTVQGVGYEIKQKELTAFSDELRDLGEKMDKYFTYGGLTQIVGSLGTDVATYKTKEDLFEQYKNDTNLKAAYLEKIGNHVDAVRVNKELGYDPEKTDIYDKLIEHYGKEAIQEYHWLRGKITEQNEWFKTHGSEFIDDIVKSTTDYVEGVSKPFVLRMRKGSLLLDTWDYINEKGKESEKVVDTRATDDAINKGIEGHVDEFQKWLKDRINSIYGRKGIHNGKSYITSSGNRRTFKQLYNEWTAENIVKAMYADQDGVGQGTNPQTAEGLQSVVYDKYKTIEEIRKDADRLQKMEQSEYDELMKKTTDKIGEIVSVLSKQLGNVDYYYGNSMDEALIEAAKGRKTLDAVKRAFKNNGITIDNEMTGRILNLFEEVKNLPTMYFEAKRHGVVYSNEIRLLAMPKNIKDSTLDLVKQSGIDYVLYEVGNDNDRISKINEIATSENLSFSYGGSDLYEDLKSDSSAEHISDIIREKDAISDERMVKQTGEALSDFISNSKSIKTEQTGERGNRQGGQGLYSIGEESDTDKKIIAIGIAENLIGDGKIDIVGTKLSRFPRKALEQIAILHMAVRDPRFETGRYIFTRGNEIVGTNAYTLYLPNKTYLRSVADGITQEKIIKMRMKALGADGFYTLHNHPSGQINPSRADTVSTKQIAHNLDGFKGCIIIDHNKYSVINKDGKSKQYKINKPTASVEFEQRILDHPLLFKTLTPDTIGNVMADLVHSISNRYSTIVYASTANTIRSIEEVANAYTYSDEFEKHVTDMKLRFGCSTAYLCIDPSSDFFVPKIKDMADRNIINGIAYSDGAFDEIEKNPDYSVLGIKNIETKSYKLSDDINFSFGSSDDVIEDEDVPSFMMDVGEISKAQSNAVSIIEEGMQSLKKLDVDVDQKTVEKVARGILKDYSSTYNKAIFESNIRSLFAYLQDHDNVSYSDMMRVVDEIARPVLDKAEAKDESAQEDRNHILTYLRNTKIKLDDEQKAEVKNSYGSYNDFRAKNGLMKTWSNNGVYLDDIWDELCDQSNGYLDRGVSSAYQPVAIMETLDALQAKSYKLYQGKNLDDAARDLSLDIFRRVFEAMAGESVQENKTLKAALTKATTEMIKAKKQVDVAYAKNYRSTQAAANKEIDETKLRQYDTWVRFVDELDSDIQTMQRGGDFDGVQMLLAQKEKYEERIKKLEKDNENYKQVNLRQRNSRVKQIQREKSKELKTRIQKNMDKLNAMLRDETEKKHVPVEMVSDVVDICKLVTPEQTNSKLLQQKLQKLQTLYDSYQSDGSFLSAKTGGFNGDNTSYVDYDKNLSDKIRRLQEVLGDKKYTQLSPDDLQEVYEITKAVLTQVRNANKLIANAKLENAYEGSRKAIKEVKKSGGTNNGFTKALDIYGNRHLNAYDFFHKISGYDDFGAVMSLYTELDDGQKKMLQIQKDIDDIFRPVLDNSYDKENQKNIRKLTSYNPKDMVDIGIKDSEGKPVLVTRTMRLSLIMHTYNQSNMNHVLGDGVVIPDMKLAKAGRMTEAYAEKNAHTYRFVDFNQYRAAIEAKDTKALEEMQNKAAEKIRALEEDLDDYEKRFLKAVKEMFWSYTGKQINKVSVRLNGYAKAKVMNYFPIKVDNDFTAKDFSGLITDRTVEGMGMLKGRVTSRNSILLEDIVNVILRQTRDVSLYAGYAIPVRDMNMIMNLTTRDNNGARVNLQSAINKTWGSKNLEWLQNLMKDIQGGRNNGTSIFDTLRSHFAGATLNLNVVVAFKQAASYPTAAAVLGNGPLLKAMKDIGSGFATKKGIEELEKINPLLWYRNKGNSTQELGDIRQSKGFDAKLSRIGFLNWIQGMDTGTVRTLEYASKYYVDEKIAKKAKGYEKMEPGSIEYWNAVDRIFTETVERTQPNYTALQQADITRYPNRLIKQLFMFKTQPLQNFNLVYDAVGNYRAKIKANKAGSTEETRINLADARSKLANAISSQLAAAFVYSAMDIIMKAAILNKWWKYKKDDDDEREAYEIIKEDFLEKIITDGIPSTLVGGVIAGSEIYDFVKAILTKSDYYGIDVSAVETLNDFLSDIKDLMDASDNYAAAITEENQEKYYSKIKELVLDITGTTSTLFGIPFNNVKNMADSIYRYAEGFSQEEKVIDMAPDSTIETQMNRILDAYISGNNTEFKKLREEQINATISKWSDDEEYADKDEIDAENTVDSSIQNKLKAAYLAGQLPESRMKKYLMDTDGYTEAKAEETIEGWELSEDTKILPDTLEAEVKAGHDLVGNSAIEKAYDSLTDEGYSEDTLDNKLKDKLKTMYQEGRLTYDETYDYLENELGEDPDNNDGVDEAWFTIEKWNYVDEGTYNRYSDLYDAVDVNDTNALESAAEVLTSHGVSEDDVASKVNTQTTKAVSSGTLSLSDAKTMLSTAGISGDDLITDMKKIIKTAYKKETLSYNEALNALINYGAEDAGDAYYDMEEVKAKMNGAESYSRYDALEAAVNSGNGTTIVKEVQNLTDHGVVAKTIQSQITSLFKQQYLDAYAKGNAANLQNALISAYMACGLTKDKAMKNIAQWVKDAAKEKAETK